MTSGLYAYVLSRGLVDDDLRGETGIDGAALRLVSQGPLVAVVSLVDLDEFGEEGLRRNLEDLAWLERVAVAHDAVARAVAARAPAAPLRLATIFVEEASLTARLADWEPQATRALDRVEGCGEWSVKAYVDGPSAPAGSPGGSDRPARPDSSAAGPGAGRAYLLQRRAASQQREAGAEDAARLADELHAGLLDHVVDGRRLAPQDRRLSGHRGEMILNGTYLVADDRVADLRDAVDRLAAPHAHLRVELGGPWAPYSFASLESA